MWFSEQSLDSSRRFFLNRKTDERTPHRSAPADLTIAYFALISTFLAMLFTSAAFGM